MSASVTQISEKQAQEIKATRPVYGVQKHRVSDLVPGDVTRNQYGKWDVVTGVHNHSDGRYVSVDFECGATGHAMRTVHLVDVQIVKNS